MINSNIILNHSEIVSAIMADGVKNTMLVRGEPGVGKTAIGYELAQATGFDFVYLDMANMSLGDLMMPAMNHEQKCTTWYPNEVFQLHTGAPKIIMLDEYTKAKGEVKKMMLPLVYERRLGSLQLHPGSIVFATGNLGADGVGDSMQAHEANRFVSLVMRKPSVDEWISWGMENDIDPVVLAFVENYPQVMASYLEATDAAAFDNPYVFNPRKQQTAYASPRSLEFASDLVKTRANKSHNTLHAQLCGAVGEAAAADLSAFVRIDEDLPPHDAIIADPKNAAVPVQPTNRLLVTYRLIARVTKEDIAPVMEYMARLNNEMQAIFVNKVLSSSKGVWAAQTAVMRNAAQRLHHIF